MMFSRTCQLIPKLAAGQRLIGRKFSDNSSKSGGNGFILLIVGGAAVFVGYDMFCPTGKRYLKQVC